jgi:hypothetical protein
LDPRRRGRNFSSPSPHQSQVKNPLYPLHTKTYELESQSENVEEKPRININFVVLPKDDSTGELVSENYCDCPFY